MVSSLDTMLGCEVYIADITHIVRTWGKIHITTELVVLGGELVVETHRYSKVQWREEVCTYVVRICLVQRNQLCIGLNLCGIVEGLVCLIAKFGCQTKKVVRRLQGMSCFGLACCLESESCLQFAIGCSVCYRNWHSVSGG